MQILIRHSKSIIDEYKGQGPLHLLIKTYLSNHKQLGSRDRKIIAEIVYLFYRLNIYYPECSIEEILKVAEHEGLIKHPKLQQIVDDLPQFTLPKALEVKLPSLSPSMDMYTYLTYLKSLPLVFFRRMKAGTNGIGDIVQAGIPLEQYEMPNLPIEIYGVPAATPLQQYMKASEYVIQDYNSQLCILQALELLKDAPISTIWDACSGAGGKTILLKQLCASANMYASDIRSNILHNLSERLQLYGMKKVNTIVADLTQGIPMSLHGVDIDLIIADVPCTGSGTWARTPEQFAYWDNIKLDGYVRRQEAIMNQLVEYMKEGAYLVYITCSVFEPENEGMVQYIQSVDSSMQLISQQFLDGSNIQADCMFYAVFQKK